MFPGVYSISLFLNYFIHSSLYSLIPTPVLLLPSSSQEPLVRYICESVLTNVFEHLPVSGTVMGSRDGAEKKTVKVPPSRSLRSFVKKRALFKWNPCKWTREEGRFPLGTESLSPGMCLDHLSFHLFLFTVISPGCL